MKAISQPPVAARELQGYAPLARSRSRARHCCASLSLSCLCLTSSRLEARRLGARVPRGPNSSLSSSLASSRRSYSTLVRPLSASDSIPGRFVSFSFRTLYRRSSTNKPPCQFRIGPSLVNKYTTLKFIAFIQKSPRRRRHPVATLWRRPRGVLKSPLHCEGDARSDASAA